MTSNINRPMENLVFLKVQLSKVIKHFMFLKVRTLNYHLQSCLNMYEYSRPMAVDREFVYIVCRWDLVAQGCETLAKSS